MSLYTQNLAFIKKHNPIVYQSLTSENITEDIVEYLPETDNFIISRDGMRVLLHSEFNREREFERLIAPVQETDKTIVLFGMGNGQLLSVIHDRFPQLEHLVIVEPNVEIMRCFLEKNDFVETFGIFHKVSFIIGKSVDKAKGMLETLILSIELVEKKISLVASIAYRTLYADYYNSILQGTVASIRFHRVNKNTLESFRLHWLINDWRNLKQVSTDVGVFRDTFADMPAVIVSAGPSLQNNVHLLREVKNRALVIAVGSAITILESHGIVPHFRIAVDAAVENRLLFENVDTSACPLLFNEHLFYETVQNYKGRTVHMTVLNNDTMVPYIFNKAKINAMPVRSGFSVANIALFLLLKFQCSPIILMGQDLCYSRGKMHAEGSWDEKIEEKYISKELETVDILGNSVYTNKAFLGMKKIFENIIADHPSIQFLNATEGGLAIDGAKNVRLAELIDSELSQIRDIAGDIGRILEAEEEKIPEKAGKISNVVMEIEADVVKILEYCRKIEEKYQKIQQMIETKVNKDLVMRETRKLRSLIQKVDHIEYYSTVIAPAFKEKVDIRRGVMNYKSDDWRQQWKGEIGLLLLEMEEIREYVERTQALIEEYQGKRQLNIIFE